MSLDMVYFLNFYILLSYPIFEQASIIIAIRTMNEDQKMKERKSKE